MRIEDVARIALGTFVRPASETWLDEAGHSLAEIANQPGHGNTDVIAGYLGRTKAPTHAASAMALPTTQGHLRVV